MQDAYAGSHKEAAADVRPRDGDAVLRLIFPVWCLYIIYCNCNLYKSLIIRYSITCGTQSHCYSMLSPLVARDVVDVSVESRIFEISNVTILRIGYRYPFPVLASRPNQNIMG
jgi:hypothetical protein